MTLRYEHMLDRPFLIGKNDCLSLFREFYRDNFGLDVTNYARPKNWRSDKLDLIRLLYEREGFEMITDWKASDLRPGDLLCMCIGQGNPNHFAIVVEDSQILHHLENQLSKVEVFRDFWRNCTAFVLRHPDVPDLRPVLPAVDIGTILNARHRHKTASDADPGGDA
jgi:hypothetical protein